MQALWQLTFERLHLHTYCRPNWLILGKIKHAYFWESFHANSSRTSHAPSPVQPFEVKDHYASLGVSSAASLADIKKAFRQQASLHHPDRNDDPGAPARFRSVQEAYGVLSDDNKRQAYDDNRRRNLLDSPIDTAREIWQTYFNRLI